MKDVPVTLIDQQSQSLGMLTLGRHGDHHVGQIAMATSSPIRAIFERYEQIVEGQIISLVDEIESEIEMLQLRVMYPDGSITDVSDVQIYPSTGAISFAVHQLVSNK